MRTKRTRRLTVVTATTLLLAACGSDDDGGAAEAETAIAPSVVVSLTDRGCSPAVLATAAGEVSFAVTNAVTGTRSKSEFEIISGEPRILAEEFFAAGETRTVTLRLPAGEYELICGAPSNTRAALTVTGEGGEDAAALNVDAAALQANVDEYLAYVDGQLQALVSANQSFRDAIAAGDLTRARDLYMPARVPWERIEPIAELFPNSDAVLDSRADDFAAGADDPAFTGWHRLEYLLFDRSTVEGALPVADRLLTDIDTLVGAVRGITIDASTMINGAAALIEEAAMGKITGEEERYAGTSLSTFASNVEGAAAIVDLNATLLRTVDPTLLEDISASFAAIRSGLAAYASGDGTYAHYDTFAAADRARLQAELASLSEDLSRVAAAFGLEVG